MCKKELWNIIQATFLVQHSIVDVTPTCLINKWNKSGENDEIELIIFNVSFHTQLTMTSFRVMQPYKHVIIAKTIKHN